MFKFSFFIGYTSGSTCAVNLGKMMRTLAHILLKKLSKQVPLSPLKKLQPTKKKPNNKKQLNDSVGAVKF